MQITIILLTNKSSAKDFLNFLIIAFDLVLWVLNEYHFVIWWAFDMFCDIEYNSSPDIEIKNDTKYWTDVLLNDSL